MSPSFPQCRQDGAEFVISVNRKLKEETRFSSRDFPVSIYSQFYNHAAHDFVPFHWHEELQLTWAARGNLAYRVGSQSFALKQGQLLLVKSRELHSSQTVGQDVCTLCINFKPELFHPQLLKHYILPLLENDAFSFALLTLKPYELPLLKQLLSEGAEQASYFSIVNFLSRVLEEVLIFFKEPAVQSNREEMLHFRAMLDYIHTNYASPLTVKDISARGLMGKNRCTALFDKYTSRSPIQYLKEYRLYMAKDMILTTDKSISEISIDTGFNHISRFIKQFGARYGLSPLKYRRKFTENPR